MAKTRNGAHLIPGTVHTLELSELFRILHRGATYEMSSIARESYDWNGNMTYAEALLAAELGQWSAPKIGAVTLPDISGIAQDARFYWDVAGNSFDVASFVAGEPEYWQNEETIEKPCGQIFRFAIEVGGAGNIDAFAMVNRSKAIVAIINSLELAGHSVELTIVRACTNKNGESYKFLIPIKHAGQALDMKRIQFMLGHPAFYRRLLFGIVEIAQGKNINKYWTRTDNFAPEGYIHISHKAGLSTEPPVSMNWAKEFVKTLQS